jgi:hypothetical protein
VTEKAVNDLRKTYKADWRFKMSMMEPLHLLACLTRGGKRVHAIEEFWQIDREIGSHSVPNTGMELMMMYLDLNKRELARETLTRSLEWLKRTTGLEPETFLIAWRPGLRGIDGRCYEIVEECISSSTRKL